MSDVNEISMSEYQMLRDEIARHEDQIFSIFTFSLAGSAAIIAWGLERQNWQVLAVAPLLLLPAGLLILSRVKMELRIAAYIRCFFEDGVNELNWEGVLAAASAKDRSPEMLLAMALFLPLLSAGGASLAAAWLLGHDQAYSRVILGSESLFVLALLIYVVYLLANSRRHAMEDKFMKDIHEALEKGESATGSV